MKKKTEIKRKETNFITTVLKILVLLKDWYNITNYISYYMMVLNLNFFAILKVIFFVHAKHEFINHLILRKKMLKDQIFYKYFINFVILS